MIGKIKNLPLSQYVDFLKNNRYFSFVRYGDGEWSALLETSGKIDFYETQLLSPESNRDMREALIQNFNSSGIIFGIQKYAVRIMGERIERFLKENNLEISWVDSDIFHHASIDGTIFPLIEEMRKKKVVVVGPKFLEKLPDRTFNIIRFIEVPGNNAYSKKDEIMKAILEIHQELKEDIVYSFSTGFLSKILILNLYRKMPNNFLIDFGSVWDVFCGNKSRKYSKSKQYTIQILNKNLGIKT